MQTKLLSENELDYAAYIIKNGGIVVFPTETVYGIAANAMLDSAVKKIFAAKNRPSDNPLIIHIPSAEFAEKYAFTNEKYYALAQKFMPGSLTVILNGRGNLSNLATANLSTVAVRVPKNNVALKLLELSDVPIAAPSANLSGRPSATRPEHILDELDGKVDAIILSKPCEIGLESTVVILSDPPQLLRPGAVSYEQLKEVLHNIEISKGVIEQISQTGIVHSPGLVHRHYAPRAKCVLVLGSNAEFKKFMSQQSKNFAVIGYEEEKQLANSFISIGSYKSPLENAQKIFDALRAVDFYEMVYIHLNPTLDGISLAIYNRLIRACEFNIIKL